MTGVVLDYVKQPAGLLHRTHGTNGRFVPTRTAEEILSYRRAKNKRNQERNRAYRNTVKLERGCADCGYREHHEALDFDHVRGEKRFQLAAVTCQSLAAIDAEIAKCDVVCANCHRVRTAQRRQSWE
jgi:hypothetical protein